MNKKSILITLLVLVLSAVLLMGCAPENIAAVRIDPELIASQTATGGVLSLKINPEIALHYDESGKVTKLEGRNPDGQTLIRDYTGYTGKDTTEVLTELVERIGKAGYFVDEADGKARQIILELDPGSQLPSETFLEDMAAHVKLCVQNQNWVGEREFEYENVPTEAAPTEAVLTQTVPVTPAPQTSTETTVPAGLCPVCADDDCNDGIYCDDAHEKAENLREYERLMSGDVCPTCADPDCNDGIYCDDADEKAENLREQENRKSGKRCSVCGDYDCDDGAYCDDWDDRYDDDDDDDHRGRHHDDDDDD